MYFFFVQRINAEYIESSRFGLPFCSHWNTLFFSTALF